MLYWLDDWSHVDFSDLKGKRIKEISIDDDRSKIIFETHCGETYKMYHEQDCCEFVSIDEIIGDLDELTDSVILFAEESSNCETPEGLENPEYTDSSFTWTFYKLASMNSYATIRWYGSSNGYYSESVSFLKFKKND